MPRTSRIAVSPCSTRSLDLAAASKRGQVGVGIRPEIARSCTIYAGMLAQVGQRERAVALLAEATEMVSELGMVAWNLDLVQELLNQPQA